eukprot:CAMPEP_0178419846 /NCGR_PEP_ID=MMETSP0689_2-20121128/25822_1 /TAXON_ID=160604 /ORGANISM="Amphidinium massartii, Strain CS-259" /LENGTH=696 /DNA_ID=CAMNT_0020041299 /DNA_START=52 /DNA_END=2139 /DNA_ORIENTATION=+
MVNMWRAPSATRGSMESYDASSMVSAESVNVRYPRFRKARASSNLSNASTTPQAQALFQDKDTAKANAMKRLCNIDPLSSLYGTEGPIAWFARSQLFGQLSTALVLANTLWIAIDTDSEKVGLRSALGESFFFMVETIFCILFLAEWMVRFLSLKQKRYLLLDGWLIFDTIMVILSVLEAWLIPLLSNQFQAGPQESESGMLRALRALRLSRTGRAMALFRLVPEFAVLVRSLTSALRAVFCVICLLLLFVYVNAIYFTVFAVGTGLEKTYFPDVPTSMKTLLVRGTLLDEITEVMDDLGSSSPALLVVFILFVIISACILLNMLIGVLCEVVNVTAAVEQEEMLTHFVMATLIRTLQDIGHDGRRAVSKRQFQRAIRRGHMNEVLRVLDIPLDKTTLVEYIFATSETEEGRAASTVRINDAVLMLMQLRTTVPATARDLMETKRVVLHHLKRLEDRMKSMGSADLSPSSQTAGSPGGFRAVPSNGGRPRSEYSESITHLPNSDRTPREWRSEWRSSRRFSFQDSGHSLKPPDRAPSVHSMHSVRWPEDVVESFDDLEKNASSSLMDKAPSILLRVPSAPEALNNGASACNPTLDGIRQLHSDCDEMVARMNELQQKFLAQFPMPPPVMAEKPPRISVRSAQSLKSVQSISSLRPPAPKALLPIEAPERLPCPAPEPELAGPKPLGPLAETVLLRK